MDWQTNPPFEIGTAQALQDKLKEHAAGQLAQINLEPILSQQRITDIFCAWKEDLTRSKAGNFRREEISPDHIKAAAHLTYWLRREAPIVDLKTIEYAGMYDETEQFLIEKELEGVPSPGNLTEIPLEELESIVLPKSNMTMAKFLENRQRMYAYGNELIAFTFGFMLAKNYEMQKRREHDILTGIADPSGAYIDDLCYFFKFKSVSPHAIDLIYRALLKVPKP